MSAYRLSQRYAKALIDLAKENGKVDEVNKDIRMFVDNCANSRDLMLMLKSPVITTKKKVSALESIYKGKVSDITFGFIKLLAVKGREKYLPEIGDAFIDQYNTLNNITRVKLTTAAALGDAAVSKVSSSLNGDSSVGNVDLSTEVKEDLIGGFVLQYNNKMYDASISKKLKVIRDNIIDESYISKVSK